MGGASDEMCVRTSKIQKPGKMVHARCFLSKRPMPAASAAVTSLKANL